jgi:2-oxoglutarate ferredoxin oxidoreductase subunit beta
MDNAVYGLTKGQSSPTSHEGMVTSSTPFGKVEVALNPLRMYLTFGVSYVASSLSTKVKDLASLINEAMDHPGFAVVHVQSPCTQYNDTYDQLKGNAKLGIEPQAWAIPDEHDPTDIDAAYEVVASGGVPLGVVYRDDGRPTFDSRASHISDGVKPKSAKELMESYAV